MREALRNSGIKIIGKSPWSTHFCQFYQTKEDLLDILIPYFKAGLENNEFCMWVTSKPLTDEDAQQALQKAIPNYKKYLDRGQIEILPYSQWYLIDGCFDSQRVLRGWIEKLNTALTLGFDGLRLSGNTLWLEKKDWRSFSEYEANVNNVIGNYKMLALCTYSLDNCSATEIMDVIRNHEFALVKQGNKWELIENAVYMQTKDALLESEERFRSICENSPIGIEVYDNAGNLITANKACLDIFGIRDIKDVLGFKLFEDPNITNEIKTRLKKFESVGYEAPFDFEKVKENNLYPTTKSGIIYIDTLITPLKESTSEEISGYLIQVQDITERKIAEEVRSHEKNILQVIMENTGTNLAYLDTEFNFVQVNSSYARSSHYSVEQLIGKNHFDLFPDKENEVIFKKVRDTGIPVEFHDKPFEFVGQPQRGITYWDWTLTPVKNNFGEVQGLVLSLMETTTRKQMEEALAKANTELGIRVQERTAELENVNQALNSVNLALNKEIIQHRQAEEILHQSEAKLRLLLEQMPSILWTTDTDLKITLSVGAGLKDMGSGINQAVGTQLAEFLKTQDPNYYPLAAHRRALAGDAASYELLFEGKYWNCYVEPLRDRNECIMGVIGVGFNITDKKRAEEALRALSRRLVDIQENERRSIARELHDEIGQSLTALKLMMSQAIRSSENNKPVLTEAQSVVTQLMQQVRQMSLELRPSMLDDLGLLPTLLWYIERYTSLTKIAVDFEHYGLDRKLSPDINTTVYRIVQEALTNVARHAKTKDVKVLIWANLSGLHLKIEDHGRGFSPSTVSSSLSTGISGMRERVLLSGGKLNIETVPGTGTCLTAELPLKQNSKTIKNNGEQ